MFSFKSITLIIAAAAAIVTALPGAATGAGLAKREAAPAPAVVLSGSNVARAAEAMPVDLKVRGGPTTVPDAISLYTSTVASVYAQIDAAIEAKAAVSVFVTLWAQVIVAIKALTVNLIALIGAEVDVLAGLTIDAVADLWVALILALVVKLQATVKVIAILDLSVYLSVFVEIVAAIVADVQAFIKVVVGVNAYLDVQLVAVVNILLSLALTLGASLSVIASIKGLLLL